MKLPSKIRRILRLLEDNPDLEIVSHGLAPNPWGFCTEGPHSAAHRRLSKMLESLTSTESQQLIELIF